MRGMKLLIFSGMLVAPALAAQEAAPTAVDDGLASPPTRHLRVVLAGDVAGHSEKAVSLRKNVQKALTDGSVHACQEAHVRSTHGRQECHRVDRGDVEPHDGLRSSVTRMRQLLCVDARTPAEGDGQSSLPDRRRRPDQRSWLRVDGSRRRARSATQMALTPAHLRQLDERPVPRTNTRRLPQACVRRHGRDPLAHLPDSHEEVEAVVGVGVEAVGAEEDLEIGGVDVGSERRFGLGRLLGLGQQALLGEEVDA